MSKIIGLVSWKTGDNSFGITLPYIDYFNKFGSVCLITPWVYDTNIDLLVLPGGPDINPNRYGAIPSVYISKDCPYRDYFETNLLPKYAEEGVPIFGICRGIQAIGVMYGGRLHQDIYGHETNEMDKRGEETHEVTLTESLRKLLLNNMKGKFKVNSLHHQNLIPKSLPDFLKVVAWYHKCPFGGVEAIAHTTLPIIGVQWHPEEMLNEPIARFFINHLLDKKSSLMTLLEKTVETPQKESLII